MENETIGKNIAKALYQVQSSLPRVVKDASNPHFRSKYADLTGVLSVLLPACHDAGIVLIQRPFPSENGVLALETLAIHAETGESLSGIATMPLPKPDPQGYGSAMTYARRYGLMSFFSMQTDDDDGNAASNLPQQSAPQQAQRPAQPYQQRPQGQGPAQGQGYSQRQSPPAQRPASRTAPAPPSDDDPFADELLNVAPVPAHDPRGRI